MRTKELEALVERAVTECRRQLTEKCEEQIQITADFYASCITDYGRRSPQIKKVLRQLGQEDVNAVVETWQAVNTDMIRILNNKRIKIAEQIAEAIAEVDSDFNKDDYVRGLRSQLDIQAAERDKVQSLSIEYVTPAYNALSAARKDYDNPADAEGARLAVNDCISSLRAFTVQN
ncbi:MAG: hypothetical protein EOO17_06175 [Chloroflexi bacterium]|nr:MAG: hypothetical protein EOO17_06175 [Chloroflexota bacterium]